MGTLRPRKARACLLRESPYAESRVVRFLAKPFDLQWAYVDTAAKLWNESTPNLVRQAGADNAFILARCRAPRAFDGTPLLYGRALADQHALHKDAYLIPVSLRASGWSDHGQGDLLEPRDDGLTPSLSMACLAYLAVWSPLIGRPPARPKRSGRTCWQSATRPPTRARTRTAFEATGRASRFQLPPRCCSHRANSAPRSPRY